ncbi:hypothetical protein [Cellulomonas sp. S1-8]|uniref:hypothetical protein n=1 Tax=Cellulomonas sp. S1-8 TaxID=2904790 RepID=UPI002243A844|nr:hypothetical protein [Cellulomonas sp. S1-8]UZN02110.1 hypothetical protein OKX07_13570 [Cellulomonas sp. S1-8]
MTRPYPHRPDLAFAERRVVHVTQQVARARATVARVGVADLGVVNAGLDGMWEALAWGWLLEHPLDELTALVPQGAALVRSGLDAPHGRPVELADVERWVATALLAGDDDAAERVGALAVPPPAQEADWLPVTLGALVRGDDAAAVDGAARLRDAAAAPGTAPAVAAGLAHLGDLADAVVRRDQSALDDALVARAAAIATTHATTANRRRWTGVLDRPSTGLAIAGVRRGLVVPAGVATVPGELVAAAGAGGAP